MRVWMIPLVALPALALSPGASAATVARVVAPASQDAAVTEVYYYHGRYYPYYNNHRYYRHRYWRGHRWHYY